MCRLHRRRRSNSSFAVVAATLANVAAACTIVDTPIVVGPDFQVQVHGWGRSVLGLRVEVSGPAMRRASETGSDGVVRFQGLVRGLYEVVVQPAAAMRSRAVVEVRGEGAPIVRLNWPETEPVRTRTLTGVLRGSSVERFHFDLVSGNKTMATVQADEGGGFRFEGAVPSGLYFLRLPDGVIPVALDPRAASERIDVAMALTSCGLWWADQHECAREELQVGRITGGAVMDANEASIPGARIAVAGRETLQADDLGRFGILALPDGVYDLDVSRAGFLPVRRRLRVVSSASAPDASLRVKLGFRGCGTVAVIR